MLARVRKGSGMSALADAGRRSGSTCLASPITKAPLSRSSGRPQQLGRKPGSPRAGPLTRLSAGPVKRRWVGEWPIRWDHPRRHPARRHRAGGTGDRHGGVLHRRRHRHRALAASPVPINRYHRDQDLTTQVVSRHHRRSATEPYVASQPLHVSSYFGRIDFPAVRKQV